MGKPFGAVDRHNGAPRRNYMNYTFRLTNPSGGVTFGQVSNNNKDEQTNRSPKSEHSISPGGQMRISRIAKSIGLGVGTLSLSIAAVGVAESAAWAQTTASGVPNSVISDPAPKLICDPGVTCATWAYFAPGEWCLTVYPNNENGTCTAVDMSFQAVPGPSGPFYACVFSLAGAGISSGLSLVVPYLGEATIGSALFSCGWSVFGYYLN